MNKVLLEFEKESGQRINKEKSTAMFPVYTLGRLSKAVREKLNISKSSLETQYLGSTLTLNPRTNKGDAQGIYKRIEKRLSRYRETCLSLMR